MEYKQQLSGSSSVILKNNELLLYDENDELVFMFSKQSTIELKKFLNETLGDECSPVG